MDKKQYYINKITYSLSKIDYAKSKLLGREHKNILSTVYFVLQNYKKIDLQTILNTTKLNRDDVSYGLHLLKEIGVAGWEGEFLNLESEIEVREKPDWKTFVKNLDEKISKMKNTKKSEPLKEVVQELKEEINTQEKMCEEWIEVKYSDEVIMKIKKSKLKELL